MDGKSEKGRRNHGEKLATLRPEKNLRRAHVPKLLYFGSSEVHFLGLWLQSQFSTSS